MDFEWYQLMHQTTKFKYKIDSFNDNPMGRRFTKLKHEEMLITVASFGGPIALTSDKTQIIIVQEDDPTIDNICIYSNEGEILKQIKLNNPFKNIIIHLEFLQDEMLLAVFQQGQIWLVNPLNGKVIRDQILGLYETEEVLEANVFDNGFAFLTNKNRYLFVKNAYKPQALEFLSCEQELKFAAQNKVRLLWKVFSPKQIISQKVELHLCHPTAGIIQIVQQESKKLFYSRTKAQQPGDKFPNLKGITYISQFSPNKKMVAYFCAQPIFKENPIDQMTQNMKKKKDGNEPKVIQRQVSGFTYKLVFAPSLTSDLIGMENFASFELPFVKPMTHVDLSSSPISICWCGNKAVVIQFKNHDIYLYSVHGDYLRVEKERGDRMKWSYLKQEADGCRIISKTQNKILRQIPASYISIFEAFSEEPGALLYAAYEAFENQSPLQDDQIRKEKKKLTIGVDQCLRASRFEINFDKIKRLMKAATYGKSFLPPNATTNNMIYQTSKVLRIVGCLRSKNRFITLEQFENLKDEMLLKILLRYREHYLAFEIYQFMKKDQSFRVKIYTDWACCKVENQNEHEDAICQQIRRKLQDEKGISFTQIAHRAIEIGRGDLALKLLTFEPSLAKKIPLLLWMGSKQTVDQLCFKFYERALEEALRSRDLNLLFLSISKTMADSKDDNKKVPREKIFSMLSSHKEGRAALINYFRLFDSKSYIQYNRFYLNDMEAVIMQYMRLAFAEKQYESCKSLWQCAVDLLKDFQSPMKEDWRKEAIPKTFGHLCQFMKHSPQIKFKADKVKPVTISKQLQVLMQKKDSDAVDDIKSFYKITEKRIVMTQIKILIDSEKWEDLQSFVERNQKKYNLPIELITDRLLSKRQEIWAMRIFARLPKNQWDDQYFLLQRIGKLKEAIDLAADRKSIEALQGIADKILDSGMLAYANEKIQALRKK